MTNYIVFNDIATDKGVIVPINNVVSIEAIEDGIMYVITKEGRYYTTEIDFGR